MDNGSDTNTLINLTQKLLDSIANKDWDTYASLVEEKFTAIEKEANYNVVEGLEFHKFYFDLPNDQNIAIKETIIQPLIRITGEIGIVCYKRLRTIVNIDNNTTKTEVGTETRVWRNNLNTGWRLIHFHKS